MPYRVVAKGLDRTNPGLVSRRRENKLMNHLFSSSPTTSVDWLSIPLGPAVSDEAVPEFTLSKLNATAKIFPSGKEPGPGGVPNEVLSAVHVVCPNLLLEVYNRALISAMFLEV